MTETKHAEKGDWDTDFQSNDEKSQSRENSDDSKRPIWLNMNESGKTYKIRLVGPHVKCRKFFRPYRATLQEGERDPAWAAGWYPSKRYAINVIDREDGKLKILEKGPTVFKHLPIIRPLRKLILLRKTVRIGLLRSLFLQRMASPFQETQSTQLSISKKPLLRRKR